MGGKNFIFYEYEDDEKNYLDSILTKEEQKSVEKQIWYSIDGLPTMITLTFRADELRDEVLLYLFVHKTDLLRDNWIYVHDAKVRFGRMLQLALKAIHAYLRKELAT